MNLQDILSKTTAVFRFKKSVAIITVLVAVFLAIQIPRLRTDNNVNAFLPVGNEDVRISDYYNSDRLFGSGDFFVVGLESDDALSRESLEYASRIKDETLKRARDLPSELTAKHLGLTTEETTLVLTKISEMGLTDQNFQTILVPALTEQKELVSIFGFTPFRAAAVAKKAKELKPRTLLDLVRNPLKKVRTLLNEEYVEYRDGELVTEDLFPWPDIDDARIGELHKRIEAWSIYDGYLVSADRRLTCVMIESAAKDPIVTNAVVEMVEDFVTANPVTGITVHLGGEIFINAVQDRYSNRDTAILFPIVLLVMAATLFFFFRTWQGVLYPFAAIFIAIAVALGSMSMLRIPMNIVTGIIPVLLVCVIAAYGVHQMSHYYADPSLDSHGALVRNMGTVGIGLLLSGLTTFIGFGALIVTPFRPIKEFGIFTSLGVLAGLFAAMYFIPSLILIDPSKKKVLGEEPRIRAVEGFLAFLVKMSRRHPLGITVGFGILAILLSFASSLVKSDFNPLTFFWKSDPVTVANELLGTKLSGTQSMNLVLDLMPLPQTGHGQTESSGEQRTILTPRYLEAIDSLEEELKREFPDTVGRVSSVNDLLEKINKEMHDGDPAYDRIPDSEELISQYMLLFSGDVDDFVSPDRTKLNALITLRNTDTKKTTMIRNFIFERLGGMDLADANVYVTGTARLYVVANDLMVKGSLEGIVICLVVTFLLLLPLIRHPLMTLLAMLPIFFMLLVNFGILGLSGITFDMGTSIVSSVAIGLGIDFSIHFISWYRHELTLSGDPERALDATIVNKGRAIIYNMLVVIWGFIALLFSSFVPLANFGLLVSVCVASMAGGSLMIVPAMIRLLSRAGFGFVRLGIKA